MTRHGRQQFFVAGEGVLSPDTAARSAASDDAMSPTPRLSEADELRQFRFSRIGPQGAPTSAELMSAVSEAITAVAPDSDGDIPAGFTYLGQFVDHDLTMDKTQAALGSEVTVDELIQGRSPALDLDSLYGRGPADEPHFYTDGLHLKMGRTGALDGFLPAFDGHDLPREPQQRLALIPDHRNDENLAVAQTHLAFIRFHNRVVDTIAPGPVATMFDAARERVVKHYQWMLRQDYLPRIVDPGIVEDVFANGRTLFETSPAPGDSPTMPIEFSVAAFRLGHSMIRDTYSWNRFFDNGSAFLSLLFGFSGTSGDLSAADPLPSNWIADFRRLYDFAEAGRPDLVVAPGKFNRARTIDTRLTDPLATLPAGSFGPPDAQFPPLHANLAFRNLIRGSMVKLASGQQMATLTGVTELTEDEVITGSGGVDFAGLSANLRTELSANTPLWPYILREAELNGGRLTGVGGRIVAEVFHRAMEGSAHSIVRDPHWRPDLGPNAFTFRMVDLLLFAFEGRSDLLNPLGDEPEKQLEIVELSRGDDGPFVRILQHLLRARRFDLFVDGDFGPITEQAVRRFQGNQGITIDGIVGPVTWSRLFTTVRRGDVGEAVKGVQVRMNLRQADPIDVDGDFGPITEQAVREFQISEGVEVDGVVGPITWRRCVSEPA
ncbi:peptidoglycan-binding protein [Mycobacterium deserti]|uniref:Peptidoglycan-binding protein n=1 Tax=Mycobacterium deserti TaxID=2978347 RepID=A0ABT2MJ02_9MYCO|nr:peptidoglycan-binding protein [Mycobacterium deserti]MCT7661390.1 peptidoglycan-binding protein [Mycobacterium deserti]